MSDIRAALAELSVALALVNTLQGEHADDNRVGPLRAYATLGYIRKDIFEAIRLLTTCPECGVQRPDDDRVLAGLKCARCTYLGTAGAILTNTMPGNVTVGHLGSFNLDDLPPVGAEKDKPA